MTVYKLLTGKDAPLGGAEFNYWLAYFKIKAEEEKKANSQAARQEKTPQNPARTFGG